jgi:16S rRNA (uracil1498-N3)-methyltransferase
MGPDLDPAQSLGPMAFVESLAAPELSAEDLHHFSKVLRLRDGEPMVVCDGAGQWSTAMFAAGAGRILDCTGPLVTAAKPERPVGVGFALVKGDRPELICQKLTELGVDRITPMTTQHCVVSWKGKEARQHERLVRVARSAAMQCRRTRLPVIDEVRPFGAVIELFSVAGNGAVVRGDRDGESLSERRDSVAAVLIGPEGGWSVEERSLLPESVRLAQHMLRVETAAIAAGTILRSW